MPESISTPSSKPSSNLGRHVLGAAASTFGLITLAWHDYNGWHLPRYIVYPAAAAEIFGGAAIQFRRTAKTGAVALGAVYLVFALRCVLQTAVNYSSGDFGANSVVLADLSGDGKLDLAVTNLGPCFSSPCEINSIGVLLGKGDGSFQAAATTAGPTLSGTVSSIAVADFDRDGKLDLALSNRSLMLGNGDGTLQDPQNYNPGTNDGVSEVVADFNGDGKPDPSGGHRSVPDRTPQHLRQRGTRFRYGSHAALASSNFGRWIVYVHDYHHSNERVQRQREPVLQHDCSLCDSIPYLYIQPEFGSQRFRNCNADGLHHRTTRSFRHAHLTAAARPIRMGGRRQQPAGGCFPIGYSIAPAPTRGRAHPSGPGTSCRRGKLWWCQQQQWRQGDWGNAGGQVPGAVVRSARVWRQAVAQPVRDLSAGC